MPSIVLFNTSVLLIDSLFLPLFTLTLDINVRIAQGGGGVKEVGVPIGNDAFAVYSALEIVRDGGAEQLARILPRSAPDEQSANLIATSSMVQRTSYVQRVMDPEQSLPACQRADTSAMRTLERLLELPGTADESSFFEDGCPAVRKPRATCPTPG